jgi:acetylornithine deacetylase/succinyl-diaminopimelate desuccinylase-like protein
VVGGGATRAGPHRYARGVSDWFDELAGFLRIPSISADPEHAADVLRAGEWVRDLIRGAGGECEIVDWSGRCADGALLWAL